MHPRRPQWQNASQQPRPSLSRWLPFPPTPERTLAAHASCQVGTHGSGLTYAFFMPNGTGLVELLAWHFHGQGCTWADQYFRQVLLQVPDRC